MRRPKQLLARPGVIRKAINLASVFHYSLWLRRERLTCLPFTSAQGVFLKRVRVMNIRKQRHRSSPVGEKISLPSRSLPVLNADCF